MVTAKNRIDFVRQSLRCYIDQTYSNKELLIVNEGPKSYQDQIDDLVRPWGRPDIRCVWLDGFYTLGALRNISIGLSAGELFCQWDDDDFCTPQRLSTQYSHLANHPQCQVCYLSDQLHYYYKDKTIYWDDWKSFASGGGVKKWSLIPGTLMAYRRIWGEWQVRYPSSGHNARSGEDTAVSDHLVDRHHDAVLLLEKMGYMHVYTHHGVNQVFDLRHHSAIDEARSQSREKVVQYRSQICDSLKYFNFGGEVKVMCRDGLVFTYNNDV